MDLYLLTIINQNSIPMKKTFLFLPLVILGLWMNAQTILLEEHFNDPNALPLTWTQIDQDGDGQT